MSTDLDALTKHDLPYKNLVITGFLGVGKSAAGRHIASRLHTEFVDLSQVIEAEQEMSVEDIKELYGETRLRALEHETTRNAALLRRAVIAVPGAVMLDSRSFRLLNETGRIVVLYCGLGEALHRLHLSYETEFRDKKQRAFLLARMHREYAVVEDRRLLQLDTSDITIEEESDLLLRLWATGDESDPRFRYGPPPPLKPPKKTVHGLSERKITPSGLDPR